jgi:hypothetical protein
MNDYETCERSMGELASWYTTHGQARNEATTRLHLIDRLFFECLGWEKEHVVAGERLDGQYADYTFVFPRRILIVEAKKEGLYFELPVGHDRLGYSMQTLFRSSPALKTAMEQAGSYCQQRAVPYAAVTNGHQLVAFIGARTEQNPPVLFLLPSARCKRSGNRSLCAPNYRFVHCNFRFERHAIVEGCDETRAFTRLHETLHSFF